MNPERDNEQRYYAMPKLHRWFAVGSVLLLLATLALILNDHYRPWKTYQRVYQQRDIALTEARLATLHEAIDRGTPSAGESEEGVEDDPFAEDSLPAPEAESQEGESDTPSLEVMRREVARLEKKLDQQDSRRMGMGGELLALVRDLPIVDLSAPTYRVEQIVVHESPEDLHFTQVPRVDRCMTCHAGIDNADFADEEEPYSAHPRLYLFVSSSSPHPKARFGCTACHRGQGRGTEFYSASHTPDSPREAAIWAGNHGWKENPHSESPMIETPYLEASCLPCHRDQSRVPGAEKLNWGLALIETAGCSGCHTMDHLGERPRPGPSLRRIAAKSTEAWVQAWIRNPASIRPDTWMPHVFAETEGVVGLGDARGETESAAIAAYLFGASEAFEFLATPTEGDSLRGAEAFMALGCDAGAPPDRPR